MSREAHVRICESVRVKFPRATRPLWMKITLAGSLWIKEKLRLRGIDAPELGAPEGEAAKRFITSILKPSEIDDDHNH